MKKIIVLLMLIISVKGSGQVLQKPAVYGYEFRRLAVDTLFAVPADTFSVPAALQSFPFIARKGTSFYFWNTSTHVWAAFSAAGATPTLQQVLTAGSTLTTNNTVDGGNFDLILGDFTGIELSVNSAATSHILLDGNGASRLYVSPDSITLQPQLGHLEIDTLLNKTSQNTLIGWTQTAGATRGEVGYVTLGTGLSLSSGVLSNSGVTSTPTWQQVLTAGSTLTGNNTIAGGGFNFTHNDIGTYTLRDGGAAVRFKFNTTLTGFYSPNSSNSLEISNTGTTVTGETFLTSLTNLTTQDRLIGVLNSSGRIGNVTIGSGLSLSSGVLNTSGTVPTPISSLTAATGTNSINNGNNTQTWNWPTLTNGTGLLLTSLASTTGTTGGSVLTVLRSGALANASQTTYGAIIQNQHTGTTETNVGLKVEATGATNNYALIVPSGSGNVGIGTSSPTGIFNVATQGSSATAINFHSITNDDDIFNYDESTGLISILPNASGFVGIGTASPTVALDVVGNTHLGGVLTLIEPGSLNTSISTQGGTLMAYDNSLGTFYFGDGAVEVTSGNFKTYGANTFVDLAGTGSRGVQADASGVLSAPVSDRSTKQNIQPLQTGIATIMKLNPVTFEYRKEFQNYGKGTQIGFIAQDIQQILPNSTYINNSNGKMGYNEIDLVPLLVKAMQEQQQQIDDLKNEIKKLKRK